MYQPTLIQNETYRASVRSQTGAKYGPGRERGVTLILVLVLLIITAAASVFFHNSMVGSTRMSGANRDNTASLLLAESAMEMLRGGFINKLDTDTTAVRDAGCGVAIDEDTDWSTDKCEAYSVVYVMSNTDEVNSVLDNLHYIYYVNDAVVGGGINQTAPSILQKIANGEAKTNSNSVLSSKQVSSAVTEMNIDDLFIGATAKPFIYTLDNDGLLVASAATSWTAETNQEKATAWLEMVKHVDADPLLADEEAVDIWVQAVGQAGFAGSYLQRYLGTFYQPTTIGGLAALIESSNIDRRNP